MIEVEMRENDIIDLLRRDAQGRKILQKKMPLAPNSVAISKLRREEGANTRLEENPSIARAIHDEKRATREVDPILLIAGHPA